MSVFTSLTVENCYALRRALEDGRLAPPYSASKLEKYAGANQRHVLLTEFERLSALGMTPRHIAEVLQAVEAQPVPERISLVWTGPEKPGTESRDTGVVVRELFEQATHAVLLAGFAVYQGKTVFKPLAARMDELPGLSVRMFLNVDREEGLSEAETLQRFAERFVREQWPGQRRPEVFYDPRGLQTGNKRASLHAKCIVVDEAKVLVTSANFTEAAQERNIEVGVRVDDEALAGALRLQFDGLISAGQVLRVPGI